MQVASWCSFQAIVDLVGISATRADATEESSSSPLGSSIHPFMMMMMFLMVWFSEAWMGWCVDGLMG